MPVDITLINSILRKNVNGAKSIGKAVVSNNSGGKAPFDRKPCNGSTCKGVCDYYNSCLYELDMGDVETPTRFKEKYKCFSKDTY